jgi:hypothetical protein
MNRLLFKIYPVYINYFKLKKLKLSYHMEPANHVPLFTSLDDVYEDNNNSMSERHIPRYQAIAKKFKDIYGEAP